MVEAKLNALEKYISFIIANGQPFLSSETHACFLWIMQSPFVCTTFMQSRSCFKIQ